MRQARLALLQKSLLDVVNSAVLAMSDGAKITWEYATEVHIADPLVIEVKKALQWTGIEIDDLFILAASL
jgi:hypothetical protein